MKILYGRCFGIGNAIMAVPALKALRYLNPTAEIHLLVGSSFDDIGAFDVATMLIEKYPNIVDRIVIDRAPYDVVYDLAIMAIPFDGRWVEGRDFRARQVRDGRTRPDPTTVGLGSWKKHEVRYQLDNVDPSIREFDTSFIPCDTTCLSWFDVPPPSHVYLGVGYKKDPRGQWNVKHWGNENYAELVQRILSADPIARVWTTGDNLDITQTISRITPQISPDVRDRFVAYPLSLRRSFVKMRDRCGTYVGNDTGMMHVAASLDRRVVGLFFMENSIVKNGPLCRRHVELEGWSAPLTVDVVFTKTMEMISGR